MDKFINIDFNTQNLDIYVIRNSILKSLRKFLPLAEGEFLDVGCGKMPYKEFILANSSIKNYTGIDIENALEYERNFKPDFIWNGKVMPFEDNSFDCIMATEVLEHCPEPEVVFKEIRRVLKPEGTFFFTVPFLWNLHEVPHDEYRYTPFSLIRHIENSGFNNINLIATGGWHTSMAQMLGLWVRRSPMKSKNRKYLSLFLKPIIKYLLKLDESRKIVFREGQMIPGIYGILKK